MMNGWAWGIGAALLIVLVVGLAFRRIWRTAARILLAGVLAALAIIVALAGLAQADANRRTAAVLQTTATANAGLAVAVVLLALGMLAALAGCGYLAIRWTLAENAGRARYERIERNERNRPRRIAPPPAQSAPVVLVWDGDDWDGDRAPEIVETEMWGW